MEIKAEEISQILKDRISNFNTVQQVSETGTVLSVGDGICRVHGLAQVAAGELVSKLIARGTKDGLAQQVAEAWLVFEDVAEQNGLRDVNGK